MDHGRGCPPQLLSGRSQIQLLIPILKQADTVVFLQILNVLRHRRLCYISVVGRFCK